MESSLAIEKLFKNAYFRTKERLISYIIALVISILVVMIGVAVGVVIAFGGVKLVGAANSTFTSVFIGVYAIGVTIISMYLGSWIQLAMLSVIVGDRTNDVWGMFQKVRARVWGFFKMNLLVGLFMLGLLPFGFLSFGIVFILWAVWSSFAAFIFIEKKYDGLANLWASKNMIKGHFWAVVLRIFLVHLMFWIIYGILGKNDSGLRILLPIAYFLAGPFILSYMYELYKALPAPTHKDPPRVWILVSIAGYILIVVGIVVFGTMATDYFKNNMKIKPPTAPMRISDGINTI